MGSICFSDQPRWYIGHAFWLYLEASGKLASVLRYDYRKPHVRVKAGRA